MQASQENSTMQYQVIMCDTSLEKVKRYQKNLINKTQIPGERLKILISELGKGKTKKNLKDLSLEEFIELLLNTKKPQYFAENLGQAKDDTDWNADELSILGDINITVPVTIYDNGIHKASDGITVHKEPFQGTLLFTPGALLHNSANLATPDLQEVTQGLVIKGGKVVEHGIIDEEKYLKLYERRLLPLLIYANNHSTPDNKAFITIPGIGCGVFAGAYKQGIAEKFERVLDKLLTKYVHLLPNIQAVYYDSFAGTKPSRNKIGNSIDFIVNPLTNNGKPQLCRPADYQQNADDYYSKCKFFSFVAWDHVSWPGNDFYVGSRQTDDGVKAAATDTMYQMTGYQGKYNPNQYCYDPYDSQKFSNWDKVINAHKLKLKAVERTLIVDLPGGNLYPLHKQSNTSVININNNNQTNEASKSKLFGFNSLPVFFTQKPAQSYPKSGAIGGVTQYIAEQIQRKANSASKIFISINKDNALEIAFENEKAFSNFKHELEKTFPNTKSITFAKLNKPLENSFGKFAYEIAIQYDVFDSVMQGLLKLDIKEIADFERVNNRLNKQLAELITAMIINIGITEANLKVENKKFVFTSSQFHKGGEIILDDVEALYLFVSDLRKANDNKTTIRSYNLS